VDYPSKRSLSLSLSLSLWSPGGRLYNFNGYRENPFGELLILAACPIPASERLGRKRGLEGKPRRLSRGFAPFYFSGFVGDARGRERCLREGRAAHRARSKRVYSACSSSNGRGAHEDDGRCARQRAEYSGIPPSQISPSKMPTAYLLVPPRRGRRGPPVLLAARERFSNESRVKGSVKRTHCLVLQISPRDSPAEGIQELRIESIRCTFISTLLRCTILGNCRGSLERNEIMACSVYYQLATLRHKNFPRGSRVRGSPVSPRR